MQKTLALRRQNALPRAAPLSWTYTYIYIYTHNDNNTCKSEILNLNQPILRAENNWGTASPAEAQEILSHSKQITLRRKRCSSSKWTFQSLIILVGLVGPQCLVSHTHTYVYVYIYTYIHVYIYIVHNMYVCMQCNVM